MLRIVRGGSSSVKGTRPLSAGASATLAGLTARARPEARPEVRAANLVKGVCRKDRELR